MSRYSCAFRPTGAGSTTLPQASIYAVANRSGFLTEVGIFNTTTTAWTAKLARLTTAGTQGTGQTEIPHLSVDDTADMTVFDVHSGGPTIASGAFRQAVIGAANGAGVIWTFTPPGIYIPAGTANGIGIVASTGTAQISDVYFEWDE